ncbi:MAG: carbohydrate kinase, partial [Aeromicrobium sp.]|nr:carbohydrate kinase [Aeromicrobium sp.]
MTPTAAGRQRVLVVGEALVDVVEREGEAATPHAGGSPFNVAVGLARLDVPTRLAAQLAPDEYGDLLRERLDDSGGVLDALEPVPPRTSSAQATLAADGSASYVFDLTWDPTSLPDPADFEAVHVGSLGTSLQPGAGLVADLAIMADVVGVPVSFDPNVRLTVEPDHEVWRRIFASIGPHASIIKMSDEDAKVLFPGEE